MAKSCILICTFDRPALLAKLLTALRPQAVASGATVVIADNGTRPVTDLVNSVREDMQLVYTRVEAKGLVFARNAALRAALPLRPDYLLFIDDDEVPEEHWLSRLVRVMDETGAGFATGPVLPEFSRPPPAWATKGTYFHADADSLRTSNLVVRAALVPPDETGWFHPAFNLIGGEDREFLTRLIANGAKHVIAEDASVREFVPEERLRRRYILRRSLREGVATAALFRLRQPDLLPFLGHIAIRAVRKLAYALNHLFWSFRQPRRLVSAMADLASIAGLVIGSAGGRPAFYGQTTGEKS